MMLRAKTRLKMYKTVFMFLIGLGFFYGQVHSTGNVFLAELMVESNVTLESQDVLLALNGNSELEVQDNNAVTHAATLTNELVGECMIVGPDVSCNCSTDYIWSNEVCYNYNCCRETTCNQNVSHIMPLCVAKVKVVLTGSITLSDPTMDRIKSLELTQEFETLNGFEYLNVTGQRMDDLVQYFEAVTSVKFDNSKLQAIITALETKLQAELMVFTLGMVTMDLPKSHLCYLSPADLKCTFEEQTTSIDWSIVRMDENIPINYGTEVTQDISCATSEFKSCSTLKLAKVTGDWAGVYECEMISGSVRHKAQGLLEVALLPDEIVMVSNPLTVDCSGKTSPETVVVTATIANSTENFIVSCTHPAGCVMISNTANDITQIYTFTAPIGCREVVEGQYVMVTFKNIKEQQKSASVDIPVIYGSSRFCNGEEVDGQLWPKTPKGDTAINRTCESGRVGHKERTCEGVTWKPIFTKCVNQELKNLEKDAIDFIKGLGANQDGAMQIFGKLKNSSEGFGSDSSDTTADISTSINILNLMSEASGNLALQEQVLGSLIDAASSMLNNSWIGINSSVTHNMSATYLESLDLLVKNIRVNNSVGFESENLELNFCSEPNCDVTVLDVGLNLKTTSGMVKTLVIKNLMDRLRNKFTKRSPSDLVLSATLQDNNDSSVNISLDFPTDPDLNSFCVFWNTTEHDWSEAGCFLDSSVGNRSVCKCNHLTSFSVLMAKGDISTDVLDIITNVGLGVSICSLLIFLTVESLVWSAVVKSNLSYFRHTAMVNIAVFLLLANICFLASSSPESLSETLCLTFTVCKHLFFLAMFSWMLCLSVMLVHQLIFVFSPLRKRVFMFLSAFVGYFCPVLIVGSSYMFYKFTRKPYFSSKTCWLVFERILEGSIHAFLIPVGTVILTNIFSMVVVIVTLVKSSTPDSGKGDDKETVKSIIKVVVFLTPVFGVTWVIGFALLMLDGSSPLFAIVNYSFTILNSFQGFFLLVTGCFAEQKVREALLKIIMAKSKGRSDSTKNVTSTTYTKDK